MSKFIPEIVAAILAITIVVVGFLYIPTAYKQWTKPKYVAPVKEIVIEKKPQAKIEYNKDTKAMLDEMLTPQAKAELAKIEAERNPKLVMK